MYDFLVEFRLHGYAKRYAKWVKFRARDKARELEISVKKPKRDVPHITLFGAAKTNNIKSVISDIQRISRRYELIGFQIKGFGHFDKGNRKVPYIGIEPSLKLRQYRSELARSLLRVSTECQEWDTCNPHGFLFHSAILICENVDYEKYQKLYAFVKNQCTLKDYEQDRKRRSRKIQFPLLSKLLIFLRKYLTDDDQDDPYIGQHLLRVTILVKGKIRCEYDLILRKSINRREALSKYWLRRTINRLREIRKVT